MKKLSAFKLFLILFIFSLTFTSCGYNGLVEAREEVDAQWANVESQYQRRADLIPNLVATVKGYAEHETEVYTAIANARAKLGTSITLDSSITEDEEKMKAFQQVQGELTSGLSRLLSITEAYPDLKSNENFLDLQSQLEGTENRIATERKRYNDLVGSYNKSVQSFPGLITAKMFGFKKKEYFKAESGAEHAPSVSF